MSLPKVSRLELIALMGQEYRRLLEKYPDGHDAWGDPLCNTDGWRRLALGLAIAGLAEEEYGVKHWSEILPKKGRRSHATETT
jgi:hypothetical protein